MDHRYIEEHDLVDRYLLGHLPAEERTRFEDHFVDCPRCLDELELARDFRASLRAGVADRVARSSVGAGILAWLSGPTGRILLVGGLLLVAAVPATRLIFGPDRAARVPEPQVNVPSYVLETVRSGDKRILALPVTLVLEPDASFATYRLTLRDGPDAVVWQASGVRPDPRGSVSVTFPAGSLRPGEYELELADSREAGSAGVIETHSFLITE